MAFNSKKKRVFEIVANHSEQESTWNAMVESQEDMDAVVQGVFSYVANLITTNIHEEGGDPIHEVKGALAQILIHAIDQLSNLEDDNGLQGIVDFIQQADMGDYIEIEEGEPAE